MKSILVPTDFSKCAGYAENFAIELAAKSKAQIHFLHISSVPIDWVTLSNPKVIDPYPSITRKITQVNASLQKLTAKAEKAGIKAESHLVYNSDLTAIVKCAKTYNNDFIVMGSQGSSGAKEIFMGSVAQKVVRLASTPVLTVKKPTKLKSINKIMFAADFEEKVMEQYKQVSDFSRAIGAQLHLVFINTIQNFHDSLEIKTKMGNYALYSPKVVAATHVINAYDLEGGIKLACEEGKFNLVIMITHGRQKLQRLFVGSVTERIVNHLDIPTLSYHFKNK